MPIATSVAASLRRGMGHAATQRRGYKGSNVLCVFSHSARTIFGLTRVG